MIYRHQLNSIDTAAKTNRLATIAIAAQRAAYKRTGGTVEQLGTTESHTFNFKKQHQMSVMSGKVTG
tara:strand:- start:320 stop:520 length:201 start_codon:yes stop_codon:yes gene_type:complete